jgi:hypothetical protein
MVASVSGYGLYIDCSDQVSAGTPVKCSVDSDFPTGTLFYLELYSPSDQQIARQQVTVMENKATQYKLFDTAGLSSGNYSIGVRLRDSDGSYLRSDSRIENTVIITSTQLSTTTVPTANPPTVSAITTVPTHNPTTANTFAPTTTQTTQPQITAMTSIISAAPTKSVQEMLNEQNKKIEEQNQLIAEQNKKLESQNDILNQILAQIKGVFGWK